MHIPGRYRENNAMALKQRSSANLRLLRLSSVPIRLITYISWSTPKLSTSSTCTLHIISVMSDLENDSRATAVGRKRKYGHTFTNTTTTASRRSSDTSKESGEISSSEEEDSDSDIEEISAAQWKQRPSKKKKKTTTSSSSSFSANYTSSDEGDVDYDGGMIRLCNIPPNDQIAQCRYFNITDMSEVVRCLCCGEKGHMAKDCETRTCRHCQKRDLHPSNACPIIRKCGLCRKRGHDAATCRNRSFRGADPCDVCRKIGHVEVSFQLFFGEHSNSFCGCLFKLAWSRCPWGQHARMLIKCRKSARVSGVSMRRLANRKSQK